MKRKIIFRLRKLREDKSEVIFNMKNEQELARQRGEGGGGCELPGPGP